MAANKLRFICTRRGSKYEPGPARRDDGLRGDAVKESIDLPLPDNQFRPSQQRSTVFAGCSPCPLHSRAYITTRLCRRRSHGGRPPALPLSPGGAAFLLAAAPEFFRALVDPLARRQSLTEGLINALLSAKTNISFRENSFCGPGGDMEIVRARLREEESEGLTSGSGRGSVFQK